MRSDSVFADSVVANSVLLEADTPFPRDDLLISNSAASQPDDPDTPAATDAKLQQLQVGSLAFNALVQKTLR